MGSMVDDIVKVGSLGLIDSDFAGEGAMRASERGAATTAAGQREALDYLKERETLPQYYREQAMQQLGGFYGIQDSAAGLGSQEQEDRVSQLQQLQDQFSGAQQAGGSRNRDLMAALSPQIANLQRDIDAYVPPEQAAPGMGQQDFIQGVMDSPFYSSMIEQGEEAVLRGASATGGLRSGTASENLAQNSQNVLQQLTNQRLSGLTGMSQLPSNAPQIAQGIAGVGQTLGQGQIAQGQIAQQADQNLLNTAMMGVGMFI